MPFPAPDVPPPAIATEAWREQKGTRGNPRESRGRLRQAEAPLPPSTTSQTPRHRRVLQGTVILRPQRSGLSGRTSTGQESLPIRIRHVQARDRRRAPPRRRTRSTPAPSTRPIECVQMTHAETSGVREDPASERRKTCRWQVGAASVRACRPFGNRGRWRSREHDRTKPMCVRPARGAAFSWCLSLADCLLNVRVCVGPSPGSSPRWRSISVAWVDVCDQRLVNRVGRPNGL